MNDLEAMLDAAHGLVAPILFWRFVCVVGRRFFDRFRYDQERYAIAGTEEWLAGRASEDVLCTRWFNATGTFAGPDIGHYIADEWLGAYGPDGRYGPDVLPLGEVCEILRQSLGNPFCPAACRPRRPWSLDPGLRTATAVSLAGHMDESGDFSTMPILADALQDAGCGDEKLLSHCRGPGPHVRSCWVVDLVLGKQ
ncbi:hypothetical protein [Fimbriiglobus ruber]|nr:hypothetical protein [Fimbriiglobus ruber]